MQQMYDTTQAEVKVKANQILEESAAIDAATRRRQIEAGIDGPYDPVFAEIASLRNTRRKVQVPSEQPLRASE